MKIALAVLLLAATPSFAAGERIYRCGSEYTNRIPEGNPRGCVLIEAGPGGNWQYVTLSGHMSIYVDLVARRRVGNIAKVWTMASETKLDTIQPAQVLSSIGLQEFDCIEQLSRITFAREYSQIYGRGNVITEANNYRVDWTPIMPGTVAETIGKLACEAGLVR